jgi:hypothetical protein
MLMLVGNMMICHEMCFLVPTVEAIPIVIFSVMYVICMYIYIHNYVYIYIITIIIIIIMIIIIISLSVVYNPWLIPVNPIL